MHSPWWLLDTLFAILVSYWLVNGILTEIRRSGTTEETEALQAKIDALMNEYCPDEMTEEQKANWAKHQRPVTA